LLRPSYDAALPATALPIASDFAAAEAICRRHAKSFYFASKFLPQPMRSHAYAVYAFCRLLDDSVDEAVDDEARVAALVRFDERLDGVYGGELLDDDTEQYRAVRAFAATAAACNIPRRLFEELAEGCRMDLNVCRYADWPALERYCYHVAGVVGVIMCHVFGVHDERAQRPAIAMGNAMQLTNILRDVREDYARGRIYLPADEMGRFGVTEAAIAAGDVTDGWHELMRLQIARARSLYDEGNAGLHVIREKSARRTAAVMGCVYSGILDAIERQNHDVFRRRASLSTLRKIARIPAALRLSAGGDKMRSCRS